MIEGNLKLRSRYNCCDYLEQNTKNVTVIRAYSALQKMAAVKDGRKITESNLSIEKIFIYNRAKQ